MMANDWDAILILRPGLTEEERKVVVFQLLATIEEDISKGVGGGGTHFTARITRRPSRP